MSLLITLVVGLFTLLGSIIVILTNNSKKIVDFSISIGFGVLFTLILMELLPESIELINTKYELLPSILILIILVLLGVVILKLLDKFIPDHDTHTKNNLIHVGLITSVALFIHNYLEGMAIYTSIDTSLKFGSLLGLGVALHNIPLGMSVASFFYSKGKLKSLLISLVVSLSTFLGGLTLVIFNDFIINEFTRGIILSITLGMLVYIVMFELLPHILENKNKKSSIIGILVGVSILLISTLF